MSTATFSQALACLATITPLAFSLPLTRRAVIGHDAVVGFPETVPEGIAGELYLKYKPRLKVFDGCVPFPAVQANGDTKFASHVTWQ